MSTKDFSLNPQDEILFPNPVHDNLLLSQNIKDNYDSIGIYSTDGKLLFAQKTSSLTIDLTWLSPGLYFVEFIKNDLTAKVVKILKK